MTYFGSNCSGCFDSFEFRCTKVWTKSGKWNYFSTARHNFSPINLLITQYHIIYWTTSFWCVLFSSQTWMECIQSMCKIYIKHPMLPTAHTTRSVLLLLKSAFFRSLRVGYVSLSLVILSFIAILSVRITHVKLMFNMVFEVTLSIMWWKCDGCNAFDFWPILNWQFQLNRSSESHSKNNNNSFFHFQ